MIVAHSVNFCSYIRNHNKTVTKITSAIQFIVLCKI